MKKDLSYSNTKNIYNQKNNVINIILLTLVGIYSGYISCLEEKNIFLLSIFIIVGIILFIFFFKTPKYIIPTLIIAIPLEISKVFFPFFLLNEKVGSHSVSIIDFSRLIIILIIFIWLSKNLMKGKISIWGNNITSCVFLLFLYYCLSIFITPSLNRALIEIIRFSFHLMLFLAVIKFIDSVEKLDIIIKTFLIVGLILSILGIYQSFTGHFFWNGDFGHISGIYRVHTTFADPNFFARYLVIVIIIGFICYSKRILNNRFLILTIITCILCLFCTFSRTGWLVLILSFFLILYFSKSQERIKIIKQLSLVGVIVIPFILFNKDVLARMYNIFAFGDRLKLIKGGLAMFIVHPILGVGLGGYQSTLIRDYLIFIGHSIDQHGESFPVTLCHTSLITIASELGIIGLLLTGLIFWFLYVAFQQNRQLICKKLQAYNLSFFISIIAIFINSQSIGRLFEDPYLWLFMGLLVSLKKDIFYEKQKNNLLFS